MLLMAAKRWEVTTLSVLCVRDHRGRLDAARSLCLSVTLPTIPPGAPLSLVLHVVIRVTGMQWHGMTVVWR